MPSLHPPPQVPAPDWAGPPKRSRLPWIIALAVVLPVVLAGAFCAWGLVRIDQTQAERARAVPEDGVVPPLVADETAEPEATEQSAEPVPARPRASTYPVREHDDLSRVCDVWYYPQSPKFAGKPETGHRTDEAGLYHVRLYEVATGKKLVDKKVTGENERCPSMVFMTGDDALYSEVDDRQLYELFRSYVMKK